MTTTLSLLCVGGPRGGQRVVASEYGFKAPSHKTRISVVDYPFKAGDALAEVEYTVYKADQISTPQGMISFWIPINQTPMETMTLLMDAYEYKKKHEED